MNIKYIVFIIIISVLSFIVGGYSFYYYYYYNNHNRTVITTDYSNSHQGSSIDSSVQVSIKDKEDPEDPDLIVDTDYVAKVNGQTLSIPKLSTPTLSTSKKTTPVSSGGTQTQIKTEVDLTPVIEEVAEMKYDKDWEVGVGLNTDGQMCMAIQRNYNRDAGVELMVNQDLDKWVLMYKRKF